MPSKKFNPAKLAMLDDPERLETLRPLDMWSALGSPHPRVIVEIGAGTGSLAAMFASLAPESVVYAADIEPVMLQWMREKRPEVAAGRLVPVAAEEDHVPCADGSADLVYMVTLHHELVHPHLAYAEAFRLLAPGGQLLVADWAPRETSGGPPPELRVPARVVTGMLAGAGFVDILEHPELPWTWLVTARKPAEPAPVA
jgi:ubiquinone/menaquinone biosynthesis C-methylase UbiE